MAACGREGAARSGPSISLASANGIAPSIVATGAASVSDTNLARVLIVTTKRDDSIAVAGRYRRNGDRIEFQPMFPLDAGRTYYARLVLPESVVRAELAVPSVAGAATTRIVRSTPTTDTVPENLLRMYLEFSDSMSRQSGVEHIRLLDDAGKEVRNAFLPLEGDFWNPAHTRYTVFFDPGRVKRGILPNEEMGRPLRAGRTYTLVVDSTWRDARGRPLVGAFRQKLVAGAAVLAPITLAEWKVTAPKAGTRDSLIVVFPRALDRGLIDRAIGIETDKGARVEGQASVMNGERRWAFVPASPWDGSSYRIVALSILEDVAGNQINHPFEVDLFERVDSVAAPTRYTVAFTTIR